MAPRKFTKPRRKAPRKVQRRRRNNKVTNVAEWASLSCVRTMTILPGQPGATVTDQMYNYNQFALADFPRAVQVAQGYQFYRVTGIRLTFKPAYDSYIQGGATQKPQLYHMIDKADAIPTAITLEGLKNMGARPRAFDEKPISIIWKPSVLSATENQIFATSPNAYKVSPWLNTNDAVGAIAVWNASTVAHKGVKWYMEQPGGGAGETTVYVEVELQFQFKKPLISNMTGATHAIKGQYPALDDSPDGVVGGTDQ